MTSLQNLLNVFRQTAQSEREKGNYFERLVKVYLLNEPMYKDLFAGQVYLWEEWRRHTMKQGNSDPGPDAGIDLVAVQANVDTPNIYAIQAKFYDEDKKIRKSDGIDSFFSALGKKPFTHGMLFLTTFEASSHVNEAIQQRNKPVNIVALNDLESSVIDWGLYQHEQTTVVVKPKKTVREHQKNAITNVIKGFESADRGKLIMACGTGKTFTSLKLAEQVAGPGKVVLFLVPSLSLLSQSLTEWTQESEIKLHSFAVCSDGEIGKKRTKDDDDFQLLAHELQYPATTNPERLSVEIKNKHSNDAMTVIFATYHSIDVISNAQANFEMADIDLIVCDEAHRTTGATFDDQDESNFVKVHNNEIIKAKKRLYMTATPRIYGEMARATADRDNITLCSMDDELLFGKEFHIITFSEAVRLGLLVDYKVIVLAMSEAHISRSLQELLADENNQLKVDDAAKIIGCWKALSKQGTHDELIGDTSPMRRAVAFCQVIEISNKAKHHKVSSKNIAEMFHDVVEAYKQSELEDLAEGESLPPSLQLKCEAAHVDGGMNATIKDSKLKWLREESPDDTCRILSNVRCLSEGVDVPALDAVLFLTPRNSQVDVVQSVGRVMRNSEGKKRGYVILPVVIPAGIEPEKALDDNKTYKVVWQVLQALRSHDDRFDAMINKTDLMGIDRTKMEVIAITDKINTSRKNKQASGQDSSSVKNPNAGKGKHTLGNDGVKPPQEQDDLNFEVGEIERAIIAKVVKKCGNRHHWEDWANDIAKIAQTHITRIQTILDNPANLNERAAFQSFCKELKDDLNNQLSDAEIIEMLAQHLITKPVFDALFEGYSFAQNNPMSVAMQGVLDALQKHHIEKEVDTLERFYISVKERASGITSASGKQKIVVELYDKFFRNAFPRLTERLGIVYTPVEVVDFIIHSVNDILQAEFDQTLSSKNVHILDPFTGTGTFITRLLQSGLIAPDQLAHKYKHEIHANELVLLAYYIAAINIESVYHDLMVEYSAQQNSDKPVSYQPFDGICLTDTFQMSESEDLISELMVANSSRRKRQKKLDIRVIIGNPPYSAGQKSANDNNANIAYPYLDNRIRSTYAERSDATSTKSLMDSYVRAIRWASDRIKDNGIIGFVTGNGFIEKPAASGMRKCLVEEFTNIYVLNLRGDIRKNILSKGKAKEGENIFESGSMTGIAITLFVKNISAKNQGNIFYYDIGEDLTTEEKKEKLNDLGSIKKIGETNNGWQQIAQDFHGDWINLRDNSFSDHISMGYKKDKHEKTLFENYSLGLNSNRDSWVYNFSKVALSNNIQSTIKFYNSELVQYKDVLKINNELNPEDFVSNDESKIKWSSSLRSHFVRLKKANYLSANIIKSQYRPFTKMWLYFDGMLNHRVGQMPSIFPTYLSENRIICVSGVGAQNDFTVLMSNVIVDLHTIQTGQCFPLKLYEKLNSSNQNREKVQSDIFEENSIENKFNKMSGEYKIKDAITDAGLAHFADFYNLQDGKVISKEDIFYYIYGLLHSDDYKSRYADNLTKELPRIPRVKNAVHFWIFSNAGRALAELHINYETVEMYPVAFLGGALAVQALNDNDFYVTKMKFGKGSGKDDDGNPIKYDKTRIEYNSKITLTEIPIEAYDYIVNGKPAIEWVMERQSVNTHKDSGIVNDANDWAIESMNNPKYPLELLQRVITVSLETMKIVRSLPKLDF